MPIIKQKFIFRSDLQANPEVLYLFGDNIRRVGLGGQAKEMRGEPNAVGVATKHAPGMHPSDFFSDDQFEKLVSVFSQDLRRAFEHVKAGGIVVIPADGLGTGLSELPTRAPRVNAFLERRLQDLCESGQKEDV